MNGLDNCWFILNSTLMLKLIIIWLLFGTHITCALINTRSD